MTKARNPKVASAGDSKSKEKGALNVENDSQQSLNGVGSVTKNKSKLEKRKTTTAAKRNTTQLTVPEEEFHTSLFIQQPNTITKEQVEQLIGYIENDKMSVPQAAKKANISTGSGYNYYNKYKDDPERNIPTPIDRNTNCTKTYSQEEIKEMIKYIVDNKMSVQAASVKANMSVTTARKYYLQYLNDPNRSIPTPKTTGKPFSQDKIKEVIGYIVNDKMSVQAASVKADMSPDTARKYYLQFLNHPDNEIPSPRNNGSSPNRLCSQEKIKELISYIIDDKLSVEIASIKVNIDEKTARKYYLQYLNDPNHEIPVPKRNSTRRFLCPEDQIKQLIDHIVNDKMSVRVASTKVDISLSSARRYYSQYLNNPNHEIPVPKKRTFTAPTEDQTKELINYIINDKLSILAASKKVQMSYTLACNYYRRYIDNAHSHCEVSKTRVTKKKYTDEELQKLMDYINKSKVPIKTSARILNIHYSAAYKYAKWYNSKERSAQDTSTTNSPSE